MTAGARYDGSVLSQDRSLLLWFSDIKWFSSVEFLKYSWGPGDSQVFQENIYAVWLTPTVRTVNISKYALGDDILLIQGTSSLYDHQSFRLNLCWVEFCSQVAVLYLVRPASLAANDDDYSSVVYLIAKQIFVPIFLISSLRLWQKKVLNETKDRHHSELRGHGGQDGIFPQLSQN